MKTYKPIFFLLFLLRQVFPDDEALTKLLHFGRSLARSITFRISHPLSFMSSSTLSIHFFLGLPLLLNPSTSPCSTFAGILSFFILITCNFFGGRGQSIVTSYLRGLNCCDEV